MRTWLYAIHGLVVRLGALVLSTVAAAAQAADAPVTVEEAHLTDYWTRTKSQGQAPALFPKSAIRVAASGCVSVAFTIEADGKAHSPKVLNSFISRQDGDEIRAEFEKSVVENVPHWRFAPAAANDKRQSIYTYVTVTAVSELGLHSKAFQAETTAHCKVDDFAAQAAGTNSQTQEQKS